MKSSLIPLLLAGLLGCGPAPTPPAQDAGPDTSCGLDCAAQEHFGLIVDRCFEYSSAQAASNPASLGVVVKKVEALEGGLQVLPLEYRESGQVKMTDYFHLKDGDLWLARRTFLPGQSVTYRNGEGGIVGITWLKATSMAGENFTTMASADVVGSGARRSEETSYKVTLAAATPSEQLVPVGSFPDAVKMLLSETPDHGADPRRVFKGGSGFTLFSSAFSIVGGTAQEYRLQKIRDLTGQDAGTLVDCGFGAP